MPTWTCDAPIGSAVFVAAFAVVVGDDGSDAAVAEFDVLFSAAVAAEEPAAAQDECTELAVVAAAVDAVVAVGCNTVDRTAAVADVAVAAGEYNELDTAAAVVVGDGYTDGGVDIVVDDTAAAVAADGRTAVDGVNCHTCWYRGGRQPD